MSKCQFLLDLALTASPVSSALSRFYMSRAQPLSSGQICLKNTVCQKCGTIFQNDNFHVRVQPKRKLTNKITKLMRRYKSRTSLGKFQKQTVTDFLKSKNMLVISCHFCQKISKIPCQDHESRLQQRLTYKTENIPSVVPLTKKQKQKQKKKKARLKYQMLAEESIANLCNETPTLLQKKAKGSLAKSGGTDSIYTTGSTPGNTAARNRGGLAGTVASNTKSSGCSSGSKNAVRGISKAASSRHNQISSLMNSKKTDNKRKKDFKLSHQQLGRMLSQQQKKQTEGSLSEDNQETDRDPIVPTELESDKRPLFLAYTNILPAPSMPKEMKAPVINGSVRPERHRFDEDRKKEYM
ncbi:hypothetical protein ScPMuIL_015792 [Solemya velum]